MSYPKQQPAANYPPGQYPPGAPPPVGQPSQYPPPGQPGQYTPPGQPGQYPPTGQPGQYPPAGQYPPPGQPGQYPPTGQPGQYPPAGQYPPPGQQGQYPPTGHPGQYPPTGQPGQYPPAGQYPPPGQPGQYPPGPYPPVGQPGPYPPVGQPGQYPPPGQPGHYPSQGGYPPMAPGGQPSHGPQPGFDSVDSDPEDYVRSKDAKQPVTVKFVNKTTSKVKLYWIDYKGKFKKSGKIKEGRAEVVDSYEGHKFMVEGKKSSDPVINGNEMFIVRTGHGSHGEVKADITHGPKDIKNLRSAQNGHPVQLKFSNRTHSYATLELVDQSGHTKHLKDIAPKKAWSFNTFEGQYLVAHEKGKKHEKFALNYGQFWKATKPHIPNFVEKVLITEDLDDSSSSSSSD